MSNQKIKSSPRKLDGFLSTEISRFVREFQAIKIRVTPKNAEESVFEFVHPPYMCQCVTLIDNAEKFNQLKERHRVRLQRVKEARETTDKVVRNFWHRHLYEEDGKEKHIACGRAQLGDIKNLLQEAVDQGLFSQPKGRKHPNGYDLRRWLKKYGVGIDCSGFVQQVLKRLIEVCRAEIGVLDRESDLEEHFLRCWWVYENIIGRTKKVSAYM